MSNNGLPVTDVVGVSVSLGQRRTAGASSGDAYAQAAQNSAVNAAGSAAHAEQSELSSAESAENAKASEISAAGSAQSAKADAEIAQSGSNAYPNAAAAQAAIDNGKETRQYFPVWGLVGGDIWTERYENVNGLATPTGDILATRISFLELINSIYNFQEQSAKSLANTAMFKGSGVYPLLADKNNNIALGYDDNKGAIIGVDVQSEAALKAKLSGVGMSLYRGAGDIIPIIGGNNNGIALGYDTKKNELVGLFPESATSDQNRLLLKPQTRKLTFCWHMVSRYQLACLLNLFYH
ncbi:TPA: hypothetical protein ACWX2P_001534 [Serratia marcescens]